MNGLVTKHRSYLLFEESIKSKYTKKNYISHLNSFLKFTNMNSFNQLTTVSSLELQHKLENYLFKLKHTTNPNSIPSKFQGIKHFCVMNEININWNIIAKLFPQKQKTQSLRAYTTKETKTLVHNATNLRNKALIHFFASTGARIGVFDHDLSIAHMMKMPFGCTAIMLYAGDIEEYWVFLTPQATKALKAYHNYRKNKDEVFSKNTPIFATYKFQSKQIGWSGVRSVIYRTIQKSDVTRFKNKNRFDVQADHGFRKRYNTILKLNNTVNYNIAEKLMGHKNGLDGIYFTPTLKELFTEFKKIIHQLEV